MYTLKIDYLIPGEQYLIGYQYPKLGVIQDIRILFQFSQKQLVLIKSTKNKTIK